MPFKSKDMTTQIQLPIPILHWYLSDATPCKFDRGGVQSLTFYPNILGVRYRNENQIQEYRIHNVKVLCWAAFSNVYFLGDHIGRSNQCSIDLATDRATQSMYTNMVKRGFLKAGAIKYPMSNLTFSILLPFLPSGLLCGIIVLHGSLWGFFVIFLLCGWPVHALLLDFIWI